MSIRHDVTLHQQYPRAISAATNAKTGSSVTTFDWFVSARQNGTTLGVTGLRFRDRAMKVEGRILGFYLESAPKL